MRATLTHTQESLVNAVRNELGERVDGFTDEQLSLNMGRARKSESAVAAIEEWLEGLSDEVADQEDGQENDQEDSQEDGQDSAQESEGEKKGKKKAKKAEKVRDPRLKNTYCGECSTSLHISVDEQGHWHLSCPNEHSSAARGIPVTTAARMLLGLTWTQYKEAFDHDTSTATARTVALACKEGKTMDEIKEALAA